MTALLVLAIIVLALVVTNIKIVPQATEYVIEFLGKYRTTYRADADSLICHFHFFDDFSHQLVNHAMTASRAIVHGGVVHQRRFLVHQVLRIYDVFFCHLVFVNSIFIIA